MSATEIMSSSDTMSNSLTKLAKQLEGQENVTSMKMLQGLRNYDTLAELNIEFEFQLKELNNATKVRLLLKEKNITPVLLYRWVVDEDALQIMETREPLFKVPGDDNDVVNVRLGDAKIMYTFARNGGQWFRPNGRNNLVVFLVAVYSDTRNLHIAYGNAFNGDKVVLRIPAWNKSLHVYPVAISTVPVKRRVLYE